MLKILIPIMTMIMIKSTHQSMIPFSLIIIIYNLNLQKHSITKISYIFMGDQLSFWTTTLTLWLAYILIFMKMNKLSEYSMLLFAMTFILMVTFYSWNFMMFYLMFEISMIIILLIIMTWGYQPERIEAMIFMIIMTMAVSLPFMTSMMNNTSNLNFWIMSTTKISIWEYLSFMAVFMMKMPTMFLHLWLPKVHVESPIQGSMILASILLKLGSYGMIRTINMNCKMNLKFSYLIMAFAMWSTLLMSMICLTQTDLKTLIAYSSIVHMTMVFAAILTNKSKGILGSLYIMLGHGMCSSGLFYMANFIYKNSKSRSIMVNKGILGLSSMSILFWFILCMSNAPMPPSINILGEFMSFKSISNWSFLIMYLMVMLIFMSSFYSIYLFYIAAHGKYTKSMTKMNIFNSKIIYTLMLHIFPTMMITLKPQMVLI